MSHIGPLGSRKIIGMHREILEVAPSLQIDHLNGNGLDNRKSNLRECTNRENGWNSRAKLGSSSKFKGVSWDKSRQRWRAHIETKGVTHYLGRFLVEAEAARAYKQAAAIMHGEFAVGGRGDRVAVGLVG